MLLVGSGTRLAAEFIRDDGTTAPAQVSWLTDDSSVARIDAAGTLTAVGAGAVNVTAVAIGAYATLAVRVLPAFQGAWSGSLELTRCIAQFSTTCDFFAIGSIRPIRMTVLQNDERLGGTIEIAESNTTLLRTAELIGVISLAGVATIHVGSRQSDTYFGTLETIDLRITVDATGLRLNGTIDMSSIGGWQPRDLVWKFTEVKRGS